MTAEAPQPKGSAPLPLTDEQIDALDTFALSVMAPRGHDSVREFARKIEAALSASQLSVKAPKDAGRTMMSAHALCPTDMPHLERMQWMADYFLTNFNAQAAGPSVDPIERPLLQSEAADVEPTEEQLLALATDGGRASFLLPMQKQAALNRGREAWERFKAAAPLASRAPAPVDFDWTPLVEAARAEGYARGRMDEHNDAEARAPAQALGEPPTAWEIVRAAEDVGMAGLTDPYLSDGDRRINDEGKQFVKAVRQVLAWYVRSFKGAALAHRATAQAPQDSVPSDRAAIDDPVSADGDHAKGDSNV